MEQELVALLEEQNITYDKETLTKVLAFAKKIYQEEKRYEKQTYYEHCIGVSLEVAKLRLDDVSICACLLHEVVKFDIKPVEIKLKFGSEIADLITGVDRLSYLNYSNIDKLDTQTLRKMFMAIAKDIRVILIKLCDRLFNMRKASEMDSEFRKMKAKETMEIYAPIAHRLGISHLKSELEDISFHILLTEDYEYIKQKIDAKKAQREEYIAQKIEEISATLKHAEVVCTVYGRPKHFYSIYRKMKDKNCDVDDIFDLLAIRVIVGSIKDCYTVLGMVHSMYKPMPKRFKDYIAVPKTNNYQSLHTTVFGEHGIPFEIQIRTWDMHRNAEYGIAAHFMYKEKQSVLNETEQRILWIRRTLELQQELMEEVSNLNAFKGELFGEEVFVFTPKGEIKAMPKGSTTIDFAYTIHQNVAEKMIGAKINGKLVPISTKLSNTDVVQIMTSPKSEGPNFDWLKHVKTSSARNKISAFLKKQDAGGNYERGKELFEKEIRKQKIPKEELLQEEHLVELLKVLKLKNVESLFENIGFGSLSYVKVVNKLVEIYHKKSKRVINKKSDSSAKEQDHVEDTVIVEGLSNCLVKFAKCCSAIPGDDIVGYVTLSNGVSIHRKDCKNLRALDILNRTIKVKWKQKVKSKFTASLKVIANYRDTLTIEIIKKLQELKTPIITIKAEKSQDRELVVDITITVESNEELTKVIREIKKLDSVYDVRRAR